MDNTIDAQDLINELREQISDIGMKLAISKASHERTKRELAAARMKGEPDAGPTVHGEDTPT